MTCDWSFGTSARTMTVPYNNPAKPIQVWSSKAHANCHAVSLPLIVRYCEHVWQYPHHLIQVLNAATNGARGSIATNVSYTLEQQWRRLLSSLVPCVAQGICFPQFRSPHKESCAVTISDIFTTRFRRSIHLERLECWVFIVQQSSK